MKSNEIIFATGEKVEITPDFVKSLGDKTIIIRVGRGGGKTLLTRLINQALKEQ